MSVALPPPTNRTAPKFHSQSNMPATSALLQEGRYRLDHPISETSESSVFQGYDTVRDTKVVVKEIAALPNKEGAKLNFVNQAKTLASVRHDSLIQVEDYFSEIGRQYLVLEAVEGDDLQSLLDNRNTPFSLEEAVSWAEQILDALHYLHTFDPPMLHRRVRPKNIRRLIDGRVKLLAYSLPDSEIPVTTGITSDEAELNYSPLELIWDGLDAASQKVIVGDYDDRSEKILKSPPDARSDIYSVGASLYFLLTARVPVDPLERSIEMLEGNPDPLRKPCELDSTIPQDVSDVIMRAMEIKRENRFDSAVIMRQVLRTAVKKVQESNEDRELAEAAEALRVAEKAREEQAHKLAEQKARKAEEDKRRAAELQALKEREAEQMRREDERKSAEAKEKHQVEEALKKKEAELAILASEGAPHEPAAVTENSAPDKSDLVSLDKIVEKADELFVVLEPHEAVSKSTPEQMSIHESESPFSYEETKSGSKLPLMIGAFVVLLLAGVGGWVFLGSGSAKQPAPAQSSATTAVPAAPAPAPEQTTAAEPAPAEHSAVTDQPEPAQQTASAEPSQSRTVAKPGPAKAAKPAAEPAKSPEKKKVTVDDLINDN
jgi:serine/threonine protein kinase